MRITRRIAALAVATALAALGLAAPPASAIDASCMYPPSTPTLTLGLSTTAPVAGQPVYAKGRLRYNNCPVSGRPTTVRVGGRVAGVRSTDTFGYYAYRMAPLAATSVSASSSFNGVTATTRTIKLSVRTNLRARVAAIRGCRVKVTGTTYPKKSGATIYVQRRLTRSGKFIGWSTVRTARTNSKGAWATTLKLPCGSKAGISAFIKAVSGNAANRTPTVTVRVRR